MRPLRIFASLERGSGASRLLPRFGAHLPKRLLPLTLLAAAIAAPACSRGDAAPAPADGLLVAVGDTALSLSEVVAQIPSGLSYADSVDMFRSIVDSWLENILLDEFARRNLPDPEAIDRMVETYRRRLIVSCYLAQVRESSRGKVNPDSVNAYYLRHRASMTLERPVVRGLYVKMAESSPALPRARELVKNASSASVDALDRDVAPQAVQYDYFGDRWTDWQSVAEQIPYRFYDPDAFVESSPYFETSYNGFVHMLHIYDYRKTGDAMPFDFAAVEIERILDRRNIAASERSLLNSLLRAAIDDGRLRTYDYDPVAGRMVAQHAH